MDSNLHRLLSAIEARLEKADIITFKIGKSECSEERFGQYDEPYHFLGVLASGSAEKINHAECDMINYFKNHSTLKEKCRNEIGGGGGNDNSTELYIVAQKKIKSPCKDLEHLEHLLKPSPLFPFDTIRI